jgi:hypothetical protein
MRAESFGYKNAWVAVRDRSPEAVAEAMSLRNVRRCDWHAGIKAAYQIGDWSPMTCSVFVTPPIDGWVLCVGFALTAPVDARPPAFGRLAAELTDKLQTEVQYFATHRIVEAHAWARARPGGLERAYLYVGESGEKVLDEGPQSAEERALGFAFFDPGSPEAQAAGYWERKDLTHVGEEHVMALASRWSVDPSSLSERNLEVGDGLLGDLGEPPSPPSPRAAPHQRPWWRFW